MLRSTQGQTFYNLFVLFTDLLVSVKMFTTVGTYNSNLLDRLSLTHILYYIVLRLLYPNLYRCYKVIHWESLSSVLYVVPLILVKEVTHPVQKSASGLPTHYQQLREPGYMTMGAGREAIGFDGESLLV